jgi:hypothetical protein
VKQVQEWREELPGNTDPMFAGRQFPQGIDSRLAIQG